jgi:hypothetical protein
MHWEVDGRGRSAHACLDYTQLHTITITVGPTDWVPMLLLLMLLLLNYFAKGFDMGFPEFVYGVFELLLLRNAQKRHKKPPQKQ